MIKSHSELIRKYGLSRTDMIELIKQTTKRYGNANIQNMETMILKDNFISGPLAFVSSVKIIESRSERDECRSDEYYKEEEKGQDAIHKLIDERRKEDKEARENEQPEVKDFFDDLTNKMKM